jgi:peptidyl-prolyl cis-trans isomerase C
MKFIIVLFFIIISLSCEKQQQEIVVKVNHDVMSLEQFRSHFSQEQWNNLNKQDKQTFLQEWINLTLLAQEADKNKLSSTPEIQSRIENSIKKIKANALIANHLANLSATEEELFEFYKAHQNEFQEKVKQFHMQRILVKEASKLDFVRQEILDKSFVNAAKTHSEEALGRNGGVVGWVSQHDIESIFWKTLEELNQMQYRTIQTTNGYYIVRYTETRTINKSKNFLDVKEEVREKLIQNKQEDLLENLIKRLKLEAEITISL